MNSRPLKTWNLMIQSSTAKGFFSESLSLYSSMLKSNTHGDNFTFPFVVKSCAKLCSILDGKKIHAHTILLGFHSDPYVQTSLLDMYAKHSRLEDARKIFDEMPQRTLVSWNSMISAYAQGHQAGRALESFTEMRRIGVGPSSSTMVSLVTACSGSEGALRRGLSIQSYVIKGGFDSELHLLNSIMGMYVRFDMVDDACLLFDLMEEKSKVTWTTLMGGYLRNGNFSKVFDLFNRMRRDTVELDSVVFINLISSCAWLGSLQVACSVHALLVKCAFNYEPKAAASLVNLYAKCGDIFLARKVFDSVDEKDISLWTSMIGGYVRSGDSIEALDIFQRLLCSPIKPNEVTIVTILAACTESGSLTVGKRVEGYAKENGLMSDLRVQTSLVHMYCKCGCIERAKEIFDRVQAKDAAMWGVMINGYACHGRGEEALALFDDMKDESIKPDALVFTAVLSACSHAGLVEEGLKLFERMQRDYGLVPSVEHYGCVVDLLGRAGHIDSALDLIKHLPVEAQRQAWSPLMSAGASHQSVQFGKLASHDLFNEESEDAGGYVLMANLHAAFGNWEEMMRYRRLMEKRGLIKKSGWSKIDSRDPLILDVRS